MWCRDRCDPRWEVMGAGGTLGGLSYPQDMVVLWG